MTTKRSRKKTGRKTVKTEALPISKSRSLSLKSRVGVIVISAAFILGGLYLALTGGSSVSFGNTEDALALEFDNSWIGTDPTAVNPSYYGSNKGTSRFRVRANKAVTSWRMVSEGDYTGDCNESAFSGAASDKILAPNPSGFGFLKVSSDKLYLDHLLRTDDDTKSHCYEAVAAAEKAYALSPPIALRGRPELSVARSGNRLTITSDGPVFQWRALRSDNWVVKDEDCDAETYGSGATAGQVDGPADSQSMILDLTAADNGRSYCFEALTHQGFFGYVATGSLEVQSDSTEGGSLKYEFSVDSQSQLTMRRSSGPAIIGWQVIEVSGANDCVTASFSDGRAKVADNSASGSDEITFEYEGDTDYCFKPFSTSKLYAPFRLTAAKIEAVELADLEITEIRQITQQDTGTVILQATTNRPVAGGVAIRGDRIGTGYCGVNSFTAANAAYHRTRSGDPFYVTVTSADNGYEFCFKVEEVRDGQSYFATAVFKGGVDIPPPDDGEDETDDRVRPDPDPPRPPVPPDTDNEAPSITVTHQETPAKLTAQASEFVSTWRNAGPYASEPECAAERFASDFNLGHEIDLQSSDRGKWYCFAARDEAGNWGYALERVPGGEDESGGDEDGEGEGEEDDEKEDEDDEDKKDDEDDKDDDDKDKTGSSQDQDDDGISDPGSGVSSLILWIVVGAAILVGVVVTIVVVTSLNNKPKF